MARTKAVTRKSTVSTALKKAQKVKPSTSKEKKTAKAGSEVLPYLCWKCGKSYVNSAGLAQHRYRKHPELSMKDIKRESQSWSAQPATKKRSSKAKAPKGDVVTASNGKPAEVPNGDSAKAPADDSTKAPADDSTKAPADESAKVPTDISAKPRTAAPVDPERPFECPRCGKNYTNTQGLAQHTYRKHSKKAKVLAKLKSKKTRKKKDKKDSRKKKDKKDSKRKFKCTRCEKRYKNSQGLAQHVYRKHRTDNGEAINSQKSGTTDEKS